MTGTEWGYLTDRGDGTSHVTSTGHGPDAEQAARDTDAPVVRRHSDAWVEVD